MHTLTVIDTDHIQRIVLNYKLDKAWAEQEGAEPNRYYSYVTHGTHRSTKSDSCDKKENIYMYVYKYT